MPGTPQRWITGSPTSCPTPSPIYNFPFNLTSNSTPSHTSNTPPQDPPPEPSPTPQPSSPPRQPERLYDIFPAGLGSNSTSIRGKFFPITPFHLHDIFDRHRGNPHATNTVIKSAWYGKQTRSARHEFIVVLVEDLAIPGLKNCMAIDRNQNRTPAKVPNVTAASSSATASDLFRISYNGDLNQLLLESQLTPHYMLERISFQSNEPLPLFNLVALVCHISNQYPTYHPVDANCYWFTGLIWECIRKMRPTAQHEVHLQGRRGQFACVRSIPNALQVNNVLRQIQSDINLFYSETPQSPNVSIPK